MVDATPQIERIFRGEYGRVVASLVRRFGDIDVAEEAAGEALVVALEKWPTEGVPPNPGGWLTTTAGNKGIDRIRREQQRDTKHRAAQLISEDTPHEPTGIVEDDRLRLMFTCCHPALAPEGEGGAHPASPRWPHRGRDRPGVPDDRDDDGAAITRAKAKIKKANIPYRVPDDADLDERLAGVLAVVYLVFTEGYLASSEGPAIRDELTGEAIRLGRVLRALRPGDHEVAGARTDAARGVAS